MATQIHRVARLVSALALFPAALFFAVPAGATVYNVSNNSTLASALSSVNPGDSIVLANGNYSGFTVTRSGAAANPILIQAANQGQAAITSGIISFSSVSWVTLQGLDVTTTGGSFSADSTSVAVLLGMNGAADCRITRCVFDPPTNSLPANTFFTYLSGTCLSNRIDHCEYGWYVNSGCHAVRTSGNVTIAGISAPSDRMSWAFGYGPYNPNMARYTVVDHNYFHDHFTPAANGGETIQLGAIGDTGDYQSLYSLVEYNLFVNCSGDVEVISVKGSSNTLRYNTVRTSAAVFSLRAGNGDSVYGNFFLCAGTGGGIKMSEHDHKIFNNYIENSDTSNYPLMLESGNLYNVAFSHAEVVRPQMTHNTVVNPGRQVLLAHSGALPVVDPVFANNLITGSGTLYSESVASLNPVRTQNIIYGYTPGQSGFLVENPQLTGATPQRLSASSPAIGKANTNYYPYLTDDMDGQFRAIPRDIGADQYYAANAFVPRSPLTTNEVGPNAVDLEVSASPASQKVNLGATNVSYSITIASDAGFTNPVELMVNGLMPGISAGFNPLSLNGSGTSVLSITNSSSVLGGNYSFTVTATSSNLASGAGVTLQVGRLPSILAWSSTASGNWDSQNSANWFNATSNATDEFYDGDSVLLDDTAGVQTNLLIPAGGAVAPSVLTNNSSVNNFTVAGAGKITGSAKVVKLGAGTLTLNTTNDFAGGMVVAGGTLIAGNPSALGGQGGFIIVTNGATLDVNGNNLGMDSVLVSGSGVGGNGAIVNSGADAYPAVAVMEMAADTTIGGAHRWDLRASSGDSANPAAASLSTSGHGYNLTKVGTNFVGFVSVTVDPSLANINVQGGTLDLEGNTTSLGNPNSTLTVFSNATLEFYNDTFGTNLSKVVKLNDGSAILNGAGANTFLGTVTLAGNDTFNIGGVSLTLSNKISGSGNLLKTGSGTLYLLAVNSGFTGNTVASNGTLAIAVGGVISQSPQITIGSGGALSVAGTLVTGAGGIVSGGPGGSVSVSGTLIATNGVIGALAAPVGTFALNNATLQFSVSDGMTNASVGTLSLGGSGNTIAIAVMPTNSPAQYPIIKYASLGGPFNFTLAPLPAGNSGYLSNNVANGSVDLVVNTIPSTFSLAASPSSQTAPAGGGTVNYTVTLSTNAAFSGTVIFGVNGLPANTAFQFTPPSLGASGNSTLAVTTSNSTPIGAYPLTIAGTDAGNTNLASVTLAVGRTGGASLEWASTSSSAWDVTNSYNWFNWGAGTADQFYNGDTVTFDDTATVTGITIGAGIAVKPAIVTNISSDDNFVISGPGKISGPAAIVKDGTSTLTLSTTNDFTGGVTILNGVVKITCTNALGATGGSTVIQDGGTLDINGINVTNQLITVGGAGYANGGALFNSGPQQTLAFHSVTLSDDTTFGGAGRWDIRNTGGTASLNMTPPNSGFSLTKVGTNQVSLVGVTPIDSTLGDIDIQQGTFAIQTSTAQVGDASRTITIHGGATLDFYTLSTPLDKNIVIQDGGTILNEKGPSYIGGGATVTLQGNAIFNLANFGSPPSLSCNNVITGPGNLVLTNGGTLTLGAANTYTGTTLLTTGTLAFAAGGSISNSPLIVVAAPAAISGNFTVNRGQTLAGSGTVTGILTVNSNATVSPGSGAVTGVLTVGGSAFLGGSTSMKLNKAARTNDAISSSGSITYAGGALWLTNLAGGLTATDTFKLFSAPAYGVSGSLPGILPAIPALNLAWNTKTLALDGVLRITNSPTPPPAFSAAAPVGGAIVFSGTNGPAEYPVVVLISPDVGVPLGQWIPLATNNFDSHGNFVFTNLLPGGGQAFYLLKLQ